MRLQRPGQLRGELDYLARVQAVREHLEDDPGDGFHFGLQGYAP
jgi:hypothetical protein